LNSDPISPIDDRYYNEGKELARYFSERAWIEERVSVELAYLRLLQQLRIAPKLRIPKFRRSKDSVKAIEARVGHEVKAVELYIQGRLDSAGASGLSPFVHLGLTSEDTNSVAYARLLASSLRLALIPSYSALALVLARLAVREASTPMLARTHGRPAVPTSFGREMAVYAIRMAERISKLKSSRPSAKFSGAVGTYASFALMGRVDWPRVFKKFVEGMGIRYERYSTQVVPWESNSDILHCVINFNQLMIGLSRDLWTYQALDYVRFSRPGKVSSSTMPQKVNPVDLENAEGQAEVSNSLLTLIAYKPQATRLQRDLSDSVVRRMTGQALAHSLIAAKRLLQSLSTMSVDRRTMARDLEQHPEVMAEAVQVMLRLKGDEKGYQKVKRAVESGEFNRLGSYAKTAGGYQGLGPSLAKKCMREVRALLGSSS
jgi:adenylosuccinate lyase